MKKVGQINCNITNAGMTNATNLLNMLFIIMMAFLCFACSKHISVEEAKEITTTFAGKRFTPPPRKITDITEILNRNQEIPEAIKEKIRFAKSKPSKTGNTKKLSGFYFNRAEAKLYLGKPSLLDYQKAYDLVKDDSGFLRTKKGFKITWILGKQEFAQGNAEKGLALMEAAKNNYPKSDATGLVLRYASIGDFKAAEKAKAYTLGRQEERNSKSKKKSKLKNSQEQMNLSVVSAELLEIKGKFRQAEPFRKSALKAAYHLTEKNAWFPIARRVDLAKNLMNQQRFQEAEIAVRKAIKEGLNIAEKERLARAITTLSVILAKQNRLNDAEILLRQLLHILAEAGHTDDSAHIARIRFRLVQILMAQRQWDEALTSFRKEREIKQKFPDYAELSKPKPVSIEVVQSVLQKGETFISYYVTTDTTYIWAISKQGQPTFFEVTLGKIDIEKAVKQLRNSLDFPVRTFGDISEFDDQTAHTLYKKLLMPVKKVWRKSDHLIISGHEALNQIPFSVFVTKPVSLKNDRGALFSNYQSVPWLIHQVAITNSPSATAFTSLRFRLPEKSIQRAFIGFGDPLFSPEEEAHLKMFKNSKESKESLMAVKKRGLRLTKSVSLDQNPSASLTLESLQRLPDTSEEVLSIAAAFNANPDRDVYLQKRACEQTIKSMDLSDLQVILFSTHALVAGDLDGLNQPAIALSSPFVTGNPQDGLLTMDEIMGLRLNAHWVVLSACNTAAASGDGAEAVSGLGRAFFYAGSRAVLVSNWSVETTSAKELVTGLFQYQKKNKGASRSQALRAAERQLIKGKGLVDPETKKTIVSYAHPLFWAPFTIVGDG